MPKDAKYWDRELETMPRKELEALQLKLLKKMLLFAAEHSPYYKQEFKKKKLDPKKFNSLKHLEDYPFIDKIVLRSRQEAKPPLGDITAVPEDQVVYISASSGSTGVPTASPFTYQDFEDWIDYEARLFFSTGMRPRDRYCHALNFSLFVGGPCVLGAQKVGALCIHAGTVPSERLLAIMQQFKPTITWTTPSYAWYLGETAKKEGIDPAKDLNIRRIYVAGEPGGSIPATRSAIQQLWNAEVHDFYGLSDIFGACAGECHVRNGLHWAEDHIYVEVLDQNTQQAVPEGERGELVLTTLKKKARPLVRFRTGDIVSLTKERCKCGRTHLRLDGIHGRVDDMLIIRGVNVFPSDIEFVVRKMSQLTGEYRLLLEREAHLDKVTVEVEQASHDQTDRKELEELLKRQLKAHTGIAPAVVIQDDGTLPRATHKAKRVIDKRGDVWHEAK